MKWSQGHTIGYRATTERRFARILLLVLPGSILLTWAWKQLEMLRPFQTSTDRDQYLENIETAFEYKAVPSEPLCPSNQRELLQQLSLAVGMNATEWVGDDCCTWSGVSCNRRGHVQKLDLSRRDLSGTIPAFIRELTALKSLDFNQNPMLSGTVSFVGLLLLLIQ